MSWMSFLIRQKDISNPKLILRRIRPTLIRWEAMTPFVSGKMPIIIHADERQIISALNWAEKRKYKIVICRKGRMEIAEELHQIVFLSFFDVFSPLPSGKPSFRHPFSCTRNFSQSRRELSIGLRLGAWSAANQRNLPYYAAQSIPHGFKRTDAWHRLRLILQNSWSP